MLNIALSRNLHMFIPDKNIIVHPLKVTNESFLLLGWQFLGVSGNEFNGTLLFTTPFSFPANVAAIALFTNTADTTDTGVPTTLKQISSVT